MRQIKEVGDLFPGFVYATSWRDGRRGTELYYVRVIRIKTETPGEECVVTNQGNRSFSRLKWYGPFPATLEDFYVKEEA